MATVRLIAGVSPTWEERTPADIRTESAWHEGAGRDPKTAVKWSAGGSLGAQLRSTWIMPWLENARIDITNSFPWGTMTPLLPTRVVSEFTGRMEYLDFQTAFPWGKYGALEPQPFVSRFSELLPADLNRRIKWGPMAAHIDKSYRVPWAAPEFVPDSYRIPWGKGIKPTGPDGTTIIDTNLPPPTPGTSLHTVPIQDVYYQMNTATVSRLPELTALNFKSIRINTDLDSFGPRWSGTLDAASYELIKPSGATRHQIEVTINGVVWHLLVEKPGRALGFGQGDYQVSGRGLIAELAAPHASARSHVSTSARNINQLADDELDSTGWSLNWSAEVWLVPAGAWNYDNLSPIQAIGRLAEAAGAVVMPDEVLKEIHVKPRYPVSPWNWGTATPDWSIPMAVAYRASSEWSEKPVYNAVIVSGESQGVLCNVTRQGSAGDVSAPMVVDPLITHQDGGRERGRNIIANRGVQSVETLELPLRAFPLEPGLVRQAELIEYTDADGSWRGECLSSEVSATWGSGGLSIKQVVQVERHFDD